MTKLLELAAPHAVGVYLLHLLAGLGIVSTALIVLFAQKGARAHVLAGKIFIGLSLAAGITALLFMAEHGFVPNIFGTATLAVAVAVSSYLALKPPTPAVKALELAALLLTFSVCVVLLQRFGQFAAREGMISKASAFTFACAFFPLFFLLYDAYFFSLGPERRAAAKFKRHLCGMAFMIAVMVHAPVVSVFVKAPVNFYLKFFAPYALWPLIYFGFLAKRRSTRIAAATTAQHS